MIPNLDDHDTPYQYRRQPRVDLPRGTLTLGLEPDKWAVCWLARTQGDTGLHAGLHPETCPTCAVPADDLYDQISDWWDSRPGWWTA